jgi:hypothetical protein
MHNKILKVLSKFENQLSSFQIVHPKFFLSREYLLTPAKFPKIFSEYKTFIVALAAEFIQFGGGKYNWEELIEESQKIINFESSLAKLVSDENEPKRKAQYNISKLQREFDLLTPKLPLYQNHVCNKKNCSLFSSISKFYLLFP